MHSLKLVTKVHALHLFWQFVSMDEEIERVSDIYVLETDKAWLTQEAIRNGLI